MSNGMPKVLFVDLDDSLVRGDLLKEQIFELSIAKPKLIPKIFFNAIKGPVALKNFIGEHSRFDPKDLVYSEAVLEKIKSFKAEGAKVILASASPEDWVQSVAQHLNLFDGYIGTREENLKGAQKYSQMRNVSGEPFAYIGDSYADEEIWRHAHTAIAVNPSKRQKKFLHDLKHNNVVQNVQIIDEKKHLLKSLIRCLRPHQWSKNILLFVPLLGGHKLHDMGLALDALMGAVGFSLAASSVYIMNDISDRTSDRRHPTKKNRPIAAGDISLGAALSAQVSLLLCAILVSAFVSIPFLAIVLFYFGINIAYTFKLKRVPILDVVLLSGMYSTRMLAGGIATNIHLTNWLLAFSTFFFMGLALVKRYTEVSTLVVLSNAKNHSGRGYFHEDAPVLLALGIGSSLMSVLIMALYINNPQIAMFYSSPDRLWAWIPVFTYWNSRLWLLSGRKMVHDDPVVFALKDKVSWVVGLIFFVIGYSAI
jgi:4-hydroxybenzoate polyprenyltransferase